MTSDTQLRRPLLRGDLLGPAVLVVAGAAAALAGAPAALAAPLSLAASAATAERVARHRRRGPADLVLVAIAAAVGMATLLGFALNALPSGLTAASWAVGNSCLELGALACCARRPSPPSLVALLRAGARPTPLGIACGVVGVAVLAATIGMSAVTALDTAPAPSALSIVSSAGGTALVRVDAGAAAGSYALEVVTDRSRQTVVARLDLPADGSTVATVPIPPGARSTVELRSATSMAVSRRLILDRTAPASSPKGP